MRASLHVTALLLALIGGTAAEAHRNEPRPAAPEAGPVLWGPLTAGMAQRDAEKAVRAHSFGLTDQCGARPALSYSRGRLIGVTLTGRSSERDGPYCAERVRASLKADYGASDGALERALEDRAWVYKGPSPLPRAIGSIDPSRTAFDAWTTKDKSVLFTAPRRGGHWKVLYVANATPVPNPTQL